MTYAVAAYVLAAAIWVVYLISLRTRAARIEGQRTGTRR